MCACDSTTTYTIRLNNVGTRLEAKAFTGTLTYNTKASDTKGTGTGTLDLSAISTLTAAELTSTSVTMAATSQGESTTFTISFTIAGNLLDNSTIQLGLHLNQIGLSDSAFACADISDSTSLTCTASPTANSTHNFVTLGEWKYGTSGLASGTAFLLYSVMQ